MSSNFGDICRLCGDKKKIVTSLFTGQTVQKIKDTIHLKVTMDDALPKSACYECHRQVDQFYTFKSKCLKAEAKLYEIACSGTEPVNNKSVNAIKEEAGEAESHITVHSTVEHDYFAGNAAVPKVIKTEIPEEINRNALEEEPTVDSNVIFEKFVYNQALIDIKKPVVEVIVMQEAQDVLKGIEQVQTKFEVPSAVVDNFYTKPELNSDYVTNEFADEDLVLKDNETCQIDDYERVEAEIMKKADPNVKFQCTFCKLSFKFYKGYKKHRDTHHGPECRSQGTGSDGKLIFLCALCSTTVKQAEYSSYSSLKQHMYRMHLRDPPYNCSSCTLTFRSYQQYRRHIVHSHDALTYHCDFCQREFIQKSKLMMHMRKHTDERPFNCDVCGKTFRWLSSLRAHGICHGGSKDMLCAQCGHKFTDKSALMMHAKSHENISYRCTQCANSFTQLSSLRRHQNARHPVNLHTQNITESNANNSAIINENYKCFQCNKSFDNRQSLTVHLKSHYKTHQCSSCPTKCARPHQLLEHVLQVHLNVKHVCPAPGCSKAYTQHTPLSMHFRAKHPGMKLMRRTNTRLKPDNSIRSIHYNYSL